MEGRALNALNIARCKNTPNIARVDWYRVFCIDWSLDTCCRRVKRLGVKEEDIQHAHAY